MSYDHRSNELQFKQLRIEAWKSQDFNWVWTHDLAIPVRRSNQLSYEATDVESWSEFDRLGELYLGPKKQFFEYGVNRENKQ